MTNKNDEDLKLISENSQDYIPSNRDIILYTIGSIGIFAISYFLSSLLLIYAVSILGLPALYVGTVYSISQIIYAVFLPIFGNLSDDLKNNKKGSRNPLIIVGIPLLIIVYQFFWIIPPSSQFGILEIIPAVGFLFTLILYRVFMALIWAPYQATIPDLTRNEKEIIKINSYLTIFNYIGQVIGIILPNLILSQYPYPESANNDYYWINNPNGIGQQIRNSIQVNLWFLYILFVLCFLIGLIFVHIPKSTKKAASIKKKLQKKGFFQSLREISRDINSRNVFYMLIANFFVAIVYSSMNYILVNYAIYFLKLGSNLYVFTVFVVITSFSSFFLSGFFSHKFGMKKAILFCCITSSLAFFFMNIVLIPIEFLFLQLISCILFLIVTFMAGCIGIFFSSLISKMASSTEQTTDKTNSGNYLGLYYSFGVFGNIIAVLISSVLLGFYGSTALESYLWIFIYCSALHLGVLCLISKIRNI